MAENDLFQPAEGGDDVPAVDPNVDYFAELVGPDKRYKTAQEAARAIVEKDRHIDNIQNELAGMRQELNTRVTLEEFMDKMASQQDRPNPAQPANGGSEIDPPAGSVDETSVAKMIEDRLATAREQDRQKANLDFVRVELEAAFGKGYANRLQAIAKELGVGTKFLNDLAAKAPKAFLELVLKQKSDIAPGITPPQNAINAPFPSQGQKRNWQFYEKIRKENPRLYWTPKVQNELHKMAQEQGSTFFATEQN